MIDYTEGKGIQYHIGNGPKDIGKYVILTGDPGRVELISKQLDDAKFVSSNREYTTYTGYLNNTKVSVCSTGIGGASAAIALEELCNNGADTFIRVGTCGGMQLDVLGGDLLIPTAAIRTEGTSKEYAPIEYPAVANYRVVNALAKSARELNARYHTGVIHSKDSFYGEHQPELHPVGYELINKWKAFVQMGCLGSEMELASIFTVGLYRKVRVGGCIMAIANQEREAAGLENKQVHDMTMPIKVVVNAMKLLIERDKLENKNSNEI